jgi:hypothetical protein
VKRWLGNEKLRMRNEELKREKRQKVKNGK